MYRGTKDKGERFLIENNVRRQWTNIIKVLKAKKVNLEFYIRKRHLPKRKAGTKTQRIHQYLYLHN